MVAGRAAKGIHGHLHLGADVPRALGLDLLLELALPGHDRLLGAPVRGRVQLVPGRVIGRDEVRQVPDSLLNARPHGASRGELRLLLEEADVVARLDMHPAVDLRVAQGEDAHEGRLSRAVETQDAYLRAVEKRQGDVAEDLLALDLLRDADHREDDPGLFGFGHGSGDKSGRPDDAQAVRASASPD